MKKYFLFAIASILVITGCMQQESSEKNDLKNFNLRGNVKSVVQTTSYINKSEIGRAHV